jgi:Rrf2 family protein
MLRLSRKADYALISLAYLAERSGRVSSAREIAEVCELPAALLMNILKSLHQRGILKSARGASGGYAIAADLQRVSLFDLCAILDQAEIGCRDGIITGEPTRKLALHGAAQALQYRIGRFMREVSVADLVLPGRRIDVPLERVGVRRESEFDGPPRRAPVQTASVA